MIYALIISLSVKQLHLFFAAHTGEREGKPDYGKPGLSAGKHTHTSKLMWNVLKQSNFNRNITDKTDWLATVACVIARV